MVVIVLASAGDEFAAVWCAACVRKEGTWYSSHKERLCSHRREAATASRMVLMSGRTDVSFIVSFGF